MDLFNTADWKRFGTEFYKKVMDTDALGKAAQIAFYFSFAFFPLLLFLVSLFGIVLESTEGLKAEMYQYLAQILPGTAYQLVHDTLEEVVENSSGGKLTLGLLITLYSASAGVDNIRAGLNTVYEVSENRSWWWTKLLALLLTLLFIILVGVALAAVAAGWKLAQVGLQSVGIDVTSPIVLGAIQWTSVFVVLVFITAVIYSVLPSFKEFKWVWISPGAIVAIILWVALTGGFKVYLQYFNTYDKTYGSLGAVIILLLWMYLTAVAILIGGAINSTLTEMSEADKEEGDLAASTDLV
jgi:membrane protein